MREGAIGLASLAFRDLQPVVKLNRGDAEEFFVCLNTAFDVGLEMICCRNSARLQRAGECAGESTSKPGDDVIDRGRHGRGILHAVILGVTAVGAELQRLFEPFDMSFPQRPLLLHQADSRGMNDFSHDSLHAWRMREAAKKVQV